MWTSTGWAVGLRLEWDNLKPKTRLPLNWGRVSQRTGGRSPQKRRLAAERWLPFDDQVLSSAWWSTRSMSGPDRDHLRIQDPSGLRLLEENLQMFCWILTELESRVLKVLLRPLLRRALSFVALLCSCLHTPERTSICPGFINICNQPRSCSRTTYLLV